MEAKRVAQSFVQELQRVGDWAVYAEDATLIRTMFAGDAEMERLLATPRGSPRPLLLGETETRTAGDDDVAAGRDEEMTSRPTRQWVDD